MRLHLLLLPFVFVLASCDPPRATAIEDPSARYMGMYDMTVSNTPLGNVSGILNLVRKDDGSIGGTFAANGQTFNLTNVSTDEAGIDFQFYFPDYQTDVLVELEGTPGAATLTGTTLGDYPTTATRK